MKNGLNKIYDKKVRLGFIFLAIINFTFAVISLIYGTPFWICCLWLCIYGGYSITLGLKIYIKGERIGR